MKKRAVLIGITKAGLGNKIMLYHGIIVLCMVLFAACNLPAKRVEADTFSIEKDTIKSDSIRLKTDPYYRAPLVIPSGFRIDSFESYNAKQQLEISIELPVSGIKAFDKMIKEKITKIKTDYLASVDTMNSNMEPRDTSYHSQFDATIWTIYKDEKVISCPYIIYTSLSYGVHGVGDFESFNYDIKQQKAITFTDYFNVSTADDTASFIKTIKDVIAPLGAWFTELNDIDFSIQKDSVSFNFGNYKIDCYANGMFTARIAKTVLRDKIKEKYR